MRTLGHVDEDDLTTVTSTFQGNHDVQPGDDLPNPSPTSVAGSFGIAFGADEPGTISGLTLSATASGNPVTLRSQTHDVTLVQDGGDPTLWHGVANGSDVFTVKFDLGTGQYTFTLLNNLDHPDVTTEDNLLLTFGFTASDFDGDKVSGSFGIDVDDDLPTVSDGVNTEVNPSVALALDLDETVVAPDNYNCHWGNGNRKRRVKRKSSTTTAQRQLRCRVRQAIRKPLAN